MIKQQILAAFQAAQPRLFELNPDVSVWEIIESSEDGWKELEKPVYQIDVKHPFIFDLRLIPTEFNGIRVKNIWIGEFPEEFPSSNDSLPLEQWYSPERYRKFVARNLNLIAETLDRPDISDVEALDALTGDFRKHVEWCESIKKSRNEGIV
ncbi:MAG: hypothetical protein H6602_01315 [Flavobacteriales bacterium]|nr:hypothetical protein [Flavobacteriales bacterium]